MRIVQEPVMFFQGKIKLVAFALIVILSSCDGLRKSTKKHSPEETITYADGALEISITYSRPFKKDRIIFGSEEQGALVPYGEEWRTGANEATEIALNQSVKIDGQILPAGTYSIYSIPGADTWVVAINEETDYWGRTLFGSPFNEDKDVLRSELPAQMLDSVQEQFTIEFREYPHKLGIQLFWDQTLIELPVEVLK